MTIAIVGKDVSGDISGSKFVKYNVKTFLKDIQAYDEVVYVGEDEGTLRSIVIEVRNAAKPFAYIGGLSTDFITRKYKKNSRMFTSAKDYTPIKVSTPVVKPAPEPKVVVEQPKSALDKIIDGVSSVVSE